MFFRSRRSVAIFLIAGAMLGTAAVAIWPLGLRKKIRAWWYWKDGPHDGRFQDPEGLAGDKEGILYVGDEKRCQFTMLDRRGSTIASFRGIAGYPGDLSTGNRRVVLAPGHVVMIGNHDDLVEFRIEGGAGKLVRVLVGQGPSREQLTSPEGIARDAETGDLYVTDGMGRKIEVFDLEGRHRCTIGGKGSEPGRFRTPQHLAFDPDGYLIVADSDNHRLQVLTPAGAPIRIID